MPPACRTPGGLGGEGGERSSDEEFDVDALGKQLAVSGHINGEGAPAEDEEAPKVLHVLAAVLDRLVARNEQFANAPSQQGKKLTIFHGLRAPSISIAKYLERIFKYTSCSPSCFVVGYVFLDRLIHRQPDLLVTSLNVHRLLVTSVMVATKMLDDVHFNNAFFARVGGVSVVELNRLELEFLFRLDFKLSVTISVFESYCSYLERDISALEKKAVERVDRSLPAFGSAPPGSVYNNSSARTSKETSPRFKKRAVVPPGLPVSTYSNRKQSTLLQSQQPLSQYFARNSPPSR